MIGIAETPCIKRLVVEARDQELADAAVAELEAIQSERDDLCDGVAAGKRAAVACSTVTADLVRIGELCGIRDDEYPLKAAQRVVAERDALRDVCAEAYAEAYSAPHFRSDVLDLLLAASKGAKPKSETIREWAVRKVDQRFGYTAEFAPSRRAHEAEYEDEERRLAALLGGSIVTRTRPEKRSAWRALWKAAPDAPNDAHCDSCDIPWCADQGSILHRVSVAEPADVGAVVLCWLCAAVPHHIQRALRAARHKRGCSQRSWIQARQAVARSPACTCSAAHADQ